MILLLNSNTDIWDPFGILDYVLNYYISVDTDGTEQITMLLGQQTKQCNLWDHLFPAHVTTWTLIDYFQQSVISTSNLSGKWETRYLDFFTFLTILSWVCQFPASIIATKIMISARTV